MNLGNNLICTPDNEDNNYALKSNEDNYMHLVDTSIIESDVYRHWMPGMHQPM